MCRIFPCLRKIEVYNKIIVNLYCTNTQFKIIITTYPLLKKKALFPVNVRLNVMYKTALLDEKNKQDKMNNLV